jgi:hypothetical protein
VSDAESGRQLSNRVLTTWSPVDRRLGADGPESLLVLVRYDAFCAEEDKRLEGYVAALDAAALSEEVPISVGDRAPRWVILAHVANHGTQHRSELALYPTDRAPLAGSAGPDRCLFEPVRLVHGDGLFRWLWPPIDEARVKRVSPDERPVAAVRVHLE